MIYPYFFLKIKSKAIRIPINPDFFAEFVAGLTGNGYNPRTDFNANIGFTNYQDLSQLTGIYSNVSFRNINFGQAQYAGPQMYTPNTNFYGFGSY